MDSDLDTICDFVRVVYGISAFSAEQIVRGVNRTFLIEAEQKFYLRLYRRPGRSVADIRAELRTLDAIYVDQFIDVARPVPSLCNHFIAPLKLRGDRRRWAALFYEAEGCEPGMNAQDMRCAGRALARLHDQKFLNHVAPKRTLGELNQAAATLRGLASRFEFGGEIAHAAMDGMVTLYALSAPDLNANRGFCHGDFRAGNLRINADRATLFDFDDCAVGPQWLDLATMGMWIEFAAGADTAAELWRALISGYSTELLCDASFEQAICYLVPWCEIRAFQFLMSYGELEEDLWNELLDRLNESVKRGLTHRFHILDESA